MDQAQKAGTGWLAYSGIMLIIVGMLDFVDGLWALDRSDTKVDELLYADKLGTWGWIYVILGIVLIATGIGIFNRAQWARLIGVIAASISIVANMLWVFAFPITSLILILLASLVIYGLVVYGEPEM